MADRLQVKVDGPVKTVTLTRPEKRNALDAAMIVRQLKFRDGVAHDDVDALAQVARTSDDAREGVSARLGKRAPNFTGS